MFPSFSAVHLLPGYSAKAQIGLHIEGRAATIEAGEVVQQLTLRMGAWAGRAAGDGEVVVYGAH